MACRRSAFTEVPQEATKLINSLSLLREDHPLLSLLMSQGICKKDQHVIFPVSTGEKKQVLLNHFSKMSKELIVCFFFLRIVIFVSVCNAYYKIS